MSIWKITINEINASLTTLTQYMIIETRFLRRNVPYRLHHWYVGSNHQWSVYRELVAGITTLNGHGGTLYSNTIARRQPFFLWRRTMVDRGTMGGGGEW